VSQEVKFDDKGRPITWDGGYIRYDEKGRATYYIYRMVQGHQYEVSTRAHTAYAAHDHLKRFEGDPANYAPNRKASKDPIYLTPALVQNYLDFCAQPQGDRPPNTPEWRRKKKAELKWWTAKLVDERKRPLDLRCVTRADHLDPALDGDHERKLPAAKGRGHKIRVLKHLFAWLRETKRITAAEDPTFGSLKTPQARSAQKKGKKKVVARESIERVIDFITDPYSDALIVQASTGWHTTEVLRFARDGEIRDIPEWAKQPGAVAILVCPKHKRGDEHKTKVGKRAQEAAQRLLDHGPFSREWYDRAIRSACKTLGIPPFTGANMRHTNATFAVDQSGDIKKVSEFLGHTSERTTKEFYATHAVVPKVPTILDDEAPAMNSRAPAVDVEALQARIADLEKKLEERSGQDDAVAMMEAALAAMKRSKKATA
jgi:integrase